MIQQNTQAAPDTSAEPQDRRPSDPCLETVSGSPSTSVAQWLKRRRWTSGKNDIAPLFWMLNSHTFEIEAAEQIEDWQQRIDHIRSRGRNKKKLSEDAFIDRWSDLLEALHLEFLHETSTSTLVSQTFRCLGAAYFLPQVVAVESRKIALPVLASLVPLAGQVQIHDSKSLVQPWLEQLLAVELPLRLSRDFPDLMVDEDACEVASAWMASTINDRLDSDGCPAAEMLPIFGPMVASWVRSGELLEKLHAGLKPSTTELLSGAVLHILRMLRKDGQLMFSDSESAQLTEAGLKRMIKQFGNSVPRRLRQRLQDQPHSLLARRLDASPGSPSAWGRSAILRANWELDSAHVVLAFSDHSCQSEIGAKTTLISGESSPSIRFDGHPVEAIEEFSVACEEFDEDVNYLELSMSLGQEIKLTRQWLLARKEQLLFVADSLSSPRPGLIEYGCDWPMPPAISVLPETETREIYLQTRKIQALVLPISLPEWRVGSSTGQLTYQPECHSIRLTDRLQGQALHVPLVFDLCPKRAKQKRTWRQLTVAEFGQPVSREVAVAYRIQIGKEQWYCYRALQAKGFRSFLGEHFAGEFVFGRFNRKGEVHELLRIE